MLKKSVILFFLCGFLFLTGGCETIKGAYQGAKKDLGVAKEADEWMQKNLW